MSDAAAPIIPGYTLIRLLGAGNYGSVWEARDDAGFPAALKLIDRNGSHASQLELDALQSMTRLRHRHLVRTFTSFDVGTQVVIVMELAEGTLDQRLRHCVEAEQQPGVPPGELLHYLRQVAGALDYLHAHKIIHRDIKPDNLLLFHDNEPYAALGDCGLLRKQRGEDEESTVIGTPAYMSPEVWLRKAGPAGDRYNLAITYAELRQGRRPFTGPDTTSVRRAHREEDPDLDGLEEREQAVVCRALAKDPGQRYETCLEFVEALEEALQVQPFSFRVARVGLRAKNELPRASPRRPSPVERELPPGTHQPHAVVVVVEEPDCPPTVAMPGNSTPPAAPALELELETPQAPDGGRWVSTGLIGVLAAVVVAAVFWWWPRAPAENDGNGEPEPIPPVVVRGEEPAPAPAPAPAPGPGPVQAPALRVPVGFRAEGSERATIGGREYPLRLVAEKGESRFRLLVPRIEEKDDPAPFYLQENKVTNGQYRKFATESPRDAGTSWQLGGRRGDGDVGSGDDALPALRMTRPQAEAFARWLGGRLPSCAEMDRAAAWRADRKPEQGPFGPGSVAVGRRDKGPGAVGGPDDEGDVCLDTGIGGLAGNGTEWTSDDVGEFAALRGRSYTAPGPLTYGVLSEYRQQGRRVTRVQRPGHAGAYTGFRVAVAVP